MAANDPGIGMLMAGDPEKKDLNEGNPPVEDQPVAPDQFDPRFETSKAEVYTYYAYYIGDCGLNLFNFAPTAFQNLLSQAAGDAGVITFAGGKRTINSVVLICNGISFAIQIVIFLIIGSYAGKGPAIEPETGD